MEEKREESIVVVLKQLAEEEFRPRLRGMFHAYSFWIALVAGALLIGFAPSGLARVSAGIYAAGLCALFAASSAYHRCRRPRLRPILRRIDHSMIFVFIAATCTPIALLSLPAELGLTLLIAAWSAALLGIVFTMLWIHAPRGIVAGVYTVAGLISGGSLFADLTRLSIVPLALLIGGGLCYILGAVVYATKRPNPWPASFGFHEVFHTLVCVAAGAQLAAITGWVILS